MTEGRRKAIVFAVFVVAVVWGIYSNPFSSGKKPDAGSTVDQPSVNATEMPVQSEQVDRTVFPPFGHIEKRSAINGDYQRSGYRRGR
jgi:hypothetical protein